MKIHKEGHTIIIVNFLIWAAIAGLCFIFCKNGVVNWIVAGVSLCLSLFMMWFFRVPVREAVIDDSLVISPGDGKVVNVKEVEENEYFGGKCLCISIFLTFFNVHVTWFPVGGVVKYYKYHPGKYIVAFHSKASEKNERTTIAIRTNTGKEVMFRQIAGLVARRVVCYAKEGEHFAQTSEAGFIKFGSRLDVFLPLGTEVLVKKGDKVSGQTSVLARFN